MFNGVKEHYVFAIAGNETLKIINDLKQKAIDAKQEYIEYAAQSGITATLTDKGGYYEVNFELADPNTVPDGWKMQENRAGTYLDTSDNQVGWEIDRHLSSFRKKMNIQSMFNELSHALAPMSHFNNRTFSFEKVGEQIIVACPKSNDNSAIIPPGSTVISYLEYITLLEQANPTPAPQTSEFRKIYTPR